MKQFRSLLTLRGISIIIFFVASDLLILQSCETVKVSTDYVNTPIKNSSGTQQNDPTLKANMMLIGYLGFEIPLFSNDAIDENPGADLYYSKQKSNKAGLGLLYAPEFIQKGNRYKFTGGNVKSTVSGQTTKTNSFSTAGGYKNFDAGATLMVDYQLRNGISFGIGYDHGLADIATSSAIKKNTRCISLNVGYSLKNLGLSKHAR